MHHRRAWKLQLVKMPNHNTKVTLTFGIYWGCNNKKNAIPRAWCTWKKGTSKLIHYVKYCYLADCYIVQKKDKSNCCWPICSCKRSVSETLIARTFKDQKGYCCISEAVANYILLKLKKSSVRRQGQWLIVYITLKSWETLTIYKIYQNNN